MMSIIDEQRAWLLGLETMLANACASAEVDALLRARRGIYEGIADDVLRKWGARAAEEVEARQAARARVRILEKELSDEKSRYYAILNTCDGKAISGWEGEPLCQDIIVAERERIDHYQNRCAALEAAARASLAQRAECIPCGGECGQPKCPADALAKLLGRLAAHDRGDDAPRELHCEDCDRDYPVWVAPSPLWNKVVREPSDAACITEPFLCLTCFALRAEIAGVRPTAWVVRPEEASDMPAPASIDPPLTLTARCSRCGGLRMMNGTCTYARCPDPLWDNRNARGPDMLAELAAVIDAAGAVMYVHDPDCAMWRKPSEPCDKECGTRAYAAREAKANGPAPEGPPCSICERTDSHGHAIEGHRGVRIVGGTWKTGDEIVITVARSDEPVAARELRASLRSKPRVDDDEDIERCFWHFDAMHKAHYKDTHPSLPGPLSERDAFKRVVRALLYVRAKEVRATAIEECAQVAEGEDRGASPAAVAKEIRYFMTEPWS